MFGKSNNSRIGDKATKQRETEHIEHRKAPTMNFVPPDTCLQEYKKRRSAFLKHLIASTPNVSVRAKEFRRWIDENSPNSDNDEA
jgi:hypothetical protein